MIARQTPARDPQMAYQFASFPNEAATLRRAVDTDEGSPGVALLAQRCKHVERWVDECVTPPQLLWRWHDLPTQHMADLINADPDVLVYHDEQDTDLARAICAGQAIGTVSGTAAEQADGTVRIVVWASSFTYNDAGVQLDLFGSAP